MANCELKTLSDQELVELVQMKDHKAAFSELYNRYWEPLINHAGKRTGSLATAEEIVQDVFVDFYLRRKEITLSHSLAAYLKTAIKFQVFKTYRAQQVQDKYIQTAAHIGYTAPIQPDNILEAKQIHAEIIQITEKMPATCKEVFLLSRFEKRSNQDIADQLNISVAMVRKHITKSMKIMRTEIKEHQMDIFYLVLLLYTHKN
ncbi:MAG: sigma-70 family RNA polymerase sigma factor [Sphingobacterium sp.]|jgi:RNA polymerase sigma-70 factor (ECF subfamily)|uniref:RNA polymerase sigma factor n=1 Tax=unclassified Sphingobacterium TaxID=2609468 RepID=UPI00283DAAE7|nr:sigma-70 family RNA polymerase sigma factor [Sphingobacterium sp.]MDR3007116.1 sigma-70 family RNA polymerase sigma factor [Sphingobacterium sp.]